jgi:protein-S-isoprenylcysteine O-methyltransferase Ste14
MNSCAGGPFRFVRHPAYLSMILELLALALICGAVFTLLLIPALFVPVLIHGSCGWRKRRWSKKFGTAYREYQLSTPALFPYKW